VDVDDLLLVELLSESVADIDVLLGELPLVLEEDVPTLHLEPLVQLAHSVDRVNLLSEVLR